MTTKKPPFIIDLYSVVWGIPVLLAGLSLFPAGLLAQETPTPTAGTHSNQPFQYFSLPYDDLLGQAVCAGHNITSDKCDLSSAAIQTEVKLDTDMFEVFYQLSYNVYGKEGVQDFAPTLQNDARYDHDLDNPLVAKEALLYSESVIDYLMTKDTSDKHPRQRPLLPNYQAVIGGLVGTAENQFAGGDYSGMRDNLYHALWIAYPITSSVPFVPAVP